MSADQEEKFSFEETMSELEKIIAGMEKNEYTLEESLQEYEKGIALIRRAEESISRVETKLKALSEGEKKE